MLVDRGLTICQNFRVLSVSMPGKSLFKNVYFALQIAVVYSFSAVLYFAQASGVSFTFALRKRRFFLFNNLLSLFVNQGFCGVLRNDTVGINLPLNSFILRLKISQLSCTDRV